MTTNHREAAEEQLAKAEACTTAEARTACALVAIGHALLAEPAPVVVDSITINTSPAAAGDSFGNLRAQQVARPSAGRARA